MISAMPIPLRSKSVNASENTRPIKIWSANQSFCEEPEMEEEDVVSPELPKRPEFGRRKSTTFAVPGLSYDYPENLLKVYDIPESFWNKFIAALNAALSEIPKWKDPESVRRRRGLSFSEGNREVVCFGSHEPSQLDQAERVIKWWNDDYFNDKGCQVKLEFKQPEGDIENAFGFDVKPCLSLIST